MIDPIAFSVGPLDVRWYGLAYGANLALCIWIIILLNKKKPVFKDSNQIVDFTFWVFLLGVLLGGRLGYVLFYNLPYYLENPGQIIAVWKGGMSFHGGLIGSGIVAYVLGRRYKLDMVKMLDLIVVPGALADALPRVANFINRELYGRVVENPGWKWLGVDFGDGLLRYPSQLFQSASSLILFLILLVIFFLKPKRGVLIFSYLTLYGLFRFIVEFWRQPDEQIGFLIGGLSLGQLLSLGVSLVGVVGLIHLKFNSSKNENF